MLMPTGAHSSVCKATLIGGVAVIMWGMLAALTVSLKAVPPFQLLAMAFGVAFAVGNIWLLASGGVARFERFRQPLRFWLLAVAGLFTYHALYFIALRMAPAAEANIINYLWPLLIVLLSALVPEGDKLRTVQLIGALMGLAGTVHPKRGRARESGRRHLGLCGGVRLRAGLVVIFRSQSAIFDGS